MQNKNKICEKENTYHQVESADIMMLSLTLCEQNPFIVWWKQKEAAARKHSFYFLFSKSTNSNHNKNSTWKETISKMEIICDILHFHKKHTTYKRKKDRNSKIDLRNILDEKEFLIGIVVLESKQKWRRKQNK